MRYLAYAVIGMIMTGCVTTLPKWSDWSRFSASPIDEVCSAFENTERARCVADGDTYMKASSACKLSAEKFGANGEQCMSRNRLSWLLFADEFEYQFHRYHQRPNAEHWAKAANHWNPKCMDAAGANVDCQ